MFDVHCHFLAGLDDGPHTQDESLEMARVAEADGITIALLTPHGEEVAQDGGFASLQLRVDRLQRDVHAAGGKLQLLSGAEHKLSPELLRWLQDGKAPTLNKTKYVLVELDPYQFPSFAEESFFQLRVHGYTPVLAHPERQYTLQRQPAKLKKLIDQGVIVQLTGGSLEGYFGSDAKKAAETMIKEGFVHVLSTDAHRPGGKRPPILSKGGELAAKLVGQQQATLLVHDNPLAIIQNRETTLLAKQSMRSFRR